MVLGEECAEECLRYFLGFIDLEVRKVEFCDTVDGNQFQPAGLYVDGPDSGFRLAAM